jgi:hypothetical protein
MTVATRGALIARTAPLLLASAVALAACGGPGQGTPRPTDPRQILVGAIGATASLPSARIHVEVGSTTGGGVQPMQVSMAFDADVDLAMRQLVGRETLQFPGIGPQDGPQGPQTVDVIVTQTATFNRSGLNGRWSKVPINVLGGPTNVQVATMITNLLSNPSLTFELGEAAPCTLGTCDAVTAHIDGQSLGAALGPLLGVPLDAGMAASIPDFDIVVLVDQATSVISEMRTQITVQGSTTRLLLTVANAGQPVVVAPPPAALVDDIGNGLGGFGPDPTTILGTVGSEVETPMPAFPEESPAP